jgi:hypothetical protein
MNVSLAVAIKAIRTVTSKSDLYCHIHFENSLDPKIPLVPLFQKERIESILP